MFDRNHIPIGLLLQKAGLITPQQLQEALELQLQYSQMKLGEILVLQQGIRVKTIDFFVDEWQKTVELGQLFPLGYHFKRAYLLTEKQIQTILQEQKSSRDRFGELAVRQGWLEQDTVDFFLENIPNQPPQLVSLNKLEEYNRDTLHLEKKYADCSSILSRILAWTGGIPSLTKTICQVFAQSDFNILAGQEIKAVDQFVEGTLIRRWQTSKVAAPIQLAHESLTNNLRCEPRSLLTEYRDVLLGERQKFKNTAPQKELLLIGLLVCDRGQLQVSNIIYQQVFDREYVSEQLAKIPLSTSPAVPVDEEIVANTPIATIENDSSTSVEVLPAASEPNSTLVEVSSIPAAVNSNGSVVDRSSPEPLTRIGSIITCVAIALLIPLFLTINNYYSSLTKPESQKSISPKKINRLQDSCNSLNVSNLELLLNTIAQLEASQQEFERDFPDNCENALNRLRVMAAPQLGRESRILEAIRHLCKVPENSEVYVDAEVWLKRWYSSKSWGNDTKLYLEETNKYSGKGSCPAAHFTEYES